MALGALDARGRLEVVTIASLGAAERGAVVLGASAFVGDDVARFALAGGGLAAAWTVRAALRGALRVRLQRHLYARASASLLAAEPLSATPLDGDPETILFAGVHEGSLLVAERLPAVAEGVLAASMLSAVLVATSEARTTPALWLAGAGVVVAGALAFALRRVTARAGDAAWSAERPMLEQMLVAIRARAEIVANDGERRFSADLDARLTRFHVETRRAERLAGIVGRAPLGVLLAASLLVYLTYGRAIGSAAVDLVLVGSVVAAVLATLRGAHEAWKAALAFRPMAELATLPARAVGGEAAPPPDLEEIRVEGVTFRYPGATRDALSGVSLRLSRGAPVYLRGPNGSGKSTLLRLLAALGEPTAGVISAAGVDLTTIDARAWRETIAFLPQGPTTPEGMTVGEAARALGVEATDAAILESLATVGLVAALTSQSADEPLSVRVATLSTGQRKRLALARVLLRRDVQVVLLDEPDANLDADGVEVLARLIADLAKTKIVVVAAHDPRLVGVGGVFVELVAA